MTFQPFSLPGSELPLIVPIAEVPVVTIFVRHSQECGHRGDEFYKNCKCRKHLRWFYGGKQYRQSAKTRAWGAAEKAKKKVEAQFELAASESGAAVRVQAESRKTIEKAIDLFVS